MRWKSRLGCRPWPAEPLETSRQTARTTRWAAEVRAAKQSTARKPHSALAISCRTPGLNHQRQQIQASRLLRLSGCWAVNSANGSLRDDRLPLLPEEVCKGSDPQDVRTLAGSKRLRASSNMISPCQVFPSGSARNAQVVNVLKHHQLNPVVWGSDFAVSCICQAALPTQLLDMPFLGICGFHIFPSAESSRNQPVQVNCTHGARAVCSSCVFTCCSLCTNLVLLHRVLPRFWLHHLGP